MYISSNKVSPNSYYMQHNTVNYSGLLWLERCKNYVLKNYAWVVQSNIRVGGKQYHGPWSLVDGLYSVTVDYLFERLQMPFGLRTRVGPRKHVLHGAQIPNRGAIIRGKDMPGYARWHSAVSCTNMAEPIELPFALWTRVGRRKHKFSRIRQVAPMYPHWHNLANTIEPSVCGGDAALCQITLTSCFCMVMQVNYQTDCIVICWWTKLNVKSSYKRHAGLELLSESTVRLSESYFPGFGTWGQNGHCVSASYRVFLGRIAIVRT